LKFKVAMKIELFGAAVALIPARPIPNLLKGAIEND